MKPLPPGVTEHRDRTGKLRFRARGTVNGKRASLGLYETPEEAGEVYASHLDRRRTEPKGVTLAAWGERWLERRELDKLHRAVHKNLSCWRSHVATASFAGWPLRRIQRVDVLRWVKQLLRKKASRAKVTGKGATKKVAHRDLDRTLGRQTVTNALALLRRALGDAADEGIVASNVALGVRVPKVATTEEGWTYLSIDEIAALFALPLSAERRATFSVAIYSGLRGGELWGLRWADVILDGDRPELVVRHSYRGPTKSGKPRRVPLLRQAREALDAWRRKSRRIGNALVFPSASDGCHSEGFEAGWSTLRKRAGVVRRVRFHDLRHTCASHLLMGSWGRAWSLEEVQVLLGHASRTTTERYAHLSPEKLHRSRAETDRAGAIGHSMDTTERTEHT